MTVIVRGAFAGGSVARSTTGALACASRSIARVPAASHRRNPSASHRILARWASSDSNSTSAATSFSGFRDLNAGSQAKGPKVRSALIVLIGVALAATSVGIYTFYGSFKTWPAELRGDLRSAVKAHQQGDLRKAEHLFRRALDTARTLSADRLGNDALLKVSGIAISLGSVLEQAGELRRAYDVYAEALNEVKEKAQTVEDRLRAVTLAQRCGDLASIKEVQLTMSSSADRSQSVAEEHLRWSVEELIRLAVPQDVRTRILSGQQDAVMLSDLDLPAWASKTTLGASLESLGQYYAGQGRASYAIPLYIQAIDLVMPADRSKRSHEPTVAERCRTGILMNNVAQLMTDATEGQSAKVDEAGMWAIRGLDIVAFALRGTGWDMKGGQGFKTVQADSDGRADEVKGQCWTAEVALLINLGEIARMKKDNCKARDFFQRAYQSSDRYGMREARSRCAQALSELERSSTRR